jgi:hypothetical protein
MSDTTKPPATLHVRGISAQLMRQLRIECASLGQTQAQVLTAALEAYWGAKKTGGTT